MPSQTEFKRITNLCMATLTWRIIPISKWFSYHGDGCCPLNGVVGPLTNGLNSWLINGGYFTNYLHPLGAHPPNRETPGRFAKFDGALRGSSLTNGGPQNGGPWKR